MPLAEEDFPAAALLVVGIAAGALVLDATALDVAALFPVPLEVDLCRYQKPSQSGGSH